VGNSLSDRASESSGIARLLRHGVQGLAEPQVTFGEQLVRVYGSTAVNTGYYTFSYIKDGEAKTLPARYSFTFVKEGETWMIVDHHSSAMPAPPR
jgi:hypothetical protein